MFPEELFSIIKDRFKKKPHGSYIATLHKGGLDRISQKVGEEAIEVVIASKNKDKGRLVYELADLVFHTLILMAYLNVSLNDLDEELKKRRNLPKE